MKFLGMACSVLAVATAGAVDVSAWRGESLFFTFKATNATGRTVFFKPRLEGLPDGWSAKAGYLREVKFVKVAQGSEFSASRDWVCWDDSEELPAGEVREVACEIKVPAAAKAGAYALRLADAPVNLRVVDRVLPPPKEWRYYLDLWQHPWAVARFNDVKPFSKEHYDAMRPLWRELADAGQKAITATVTKLPWNHQCYDGYDSMIGRTRRADGSWAFDYSLFDEYVAFCLDCGLGPYITCYTMCPWKYVVYWRDADGREQKGAAKPGTPFFAEFWKPFLVDFQKHLSEKGWLDHTCIAMDERGPEDLKAIARLLKETGSKLKVSMAGNMDPENFRDLTFDIYSQYVEYVTPKFLESVRARREKGLVTTFYVCCVPMKPNTFMASAPAEAFWLGAYPAAVGLDGFLRWAYNSWWVDPRHDASYGNWASGDTFLVYPDNRPSRRFLELKNGIQASEKFRLLREAGGRDAELDAVAKLYDYLQAKPEATDLEPIRRATVETLNR